MRSSFALSLVALLGSVAMLSAQRRVEPRLFPVRNDRGGGTVAIDFGGFAVPPAGERCALIDPDGLIGYARVASVVRDDSNCDWCGATTAYGLLRFDTAPSRAPRHHPGPEQVGAVAVCPLSPTAPIPVLLVGETDHAAGRSYPVDLDGDGRADRALIHTTGSCPPPARVAPIERTPCHLIRGAVCESQAARSGDQWTATERAQHGVCERDANGELWPLQ